MNKSASNDDVRIERSRRALINSGLELLNANSQSSLTEIASFANVGRATLYRHFKTRDELVKAIALDCLEVMDNATQHIEGEAKSALDALRLMFQSIIPLSSQLNFIINLLALVESDKQMIAINKQQKKEIKDLVELAKSESSINKQIPTIWITSVIEGLLYSAWQMSAESTMTNDQITALTFQTFCFGFCTNQ